MKFFHNIILLFSLCLISTAVAQNTLDSFLKPADSLNIKRRNIVVASEALLATGTLISLSELWYKDYPKSGFHFKNDNDEWLQMDKAGHVFSSYHLGRFGAELLQWSGVDKKHQLIYGSTLGFAFLTVVEVFDGYSAEWGASWGDVVANASGTALYVSQELLWKEQRITPKFSFHATSYSKYRPEVLGASLNEKILKDYNGQTYWLSANIHSFSKQSKIPKWLNVAVGYGGDGMISGNVNATETQDLPKFERSRQFYLSFDVDLTKIQTRSSALKTLFSVFNTVKIPAPTFEINASGKTTWHALYF